MNQQLSWRTIVGYSLGDVANNFAFAMGALFLLSYYTDVAGVGAAAAGTMLLLVRVFDAFADVFAGRVVDSVNTRWGKFRPFLLFGTAPLMIFSVLVFWVPTDWSHSSKVVYAYLTYMGLGLCYSLVNIPYGSLATASCHIHRNGQFRIQRFNRAVYFLRQRLRRFFSRCRIFQEQRQIQRTFTLTVFPA